MQVGHPSLREVIINVASLLTMTQAVLPAMRQQGFGRIVNISSGTTRRVAVGVGAYASTKSAVNMLSAVLRQELAGDGITVSLLLPSITATEFGDGMFSLGTSPRPGMVVHSPDYVAGMVLRLLRRARSHSTSRTAPKSPAWLSGPDPPDPRGMGGQNPCGPGDQAGCRSVHASMTSSTTCSGSGGTKPSISCRIGWTTGCSRFSAKAS